MGPWPCGMLNTRSWLVGQQAIELKNMILQTYIWYDAMHIAPDSFVRVTLAETQVPCAVSPGSAWPFNSVLDHCGMKHSVDYSVPLPCHK
jgi:hypothetical protein